MDMPFNLNALTTSSVKQFVRHGLLKYSGDGKGKGMPYPKVKEQLHRMQYYTLRDGDTVESFTQATRGDHRPFTPGWGAALWTNGKIGKIQAAARAQLLATEQVKYGADVPAEHEWAFTTLEFVRIGLGSAIERFIKFRFVPPGMEHQEAALRGNVKVKASLRDQRRHMEEYQKIVASDPDKKMGADALLKTLSWQQSGNAVQSRLHDEMRHTDEHTAGYMKAVLQEIVDAMPDPQPVDRPKRSRPRLVSNRAS